MGDAVAIVRVTDAARIAEDPAGRVADVEGAAEPDRLTRKPGSEKEAGTERRLLVTDEDVLGEGCGDSHRGGFVPLTSILGASDIFIFI